MFDKVKNKFKMTLKKFKPPTCWVVVEILGLSLLGYRVTFVRECFNPQCETSRREFKYSQIPIWKRTPDEKSKKKIKTKTRSPILFIFCLINYFFKKKINPKGLAVLYELMRSPL